MREGALLVARVDGRRVCSPAHVADRVRREAPDRGHALFADSTFDPLHPLLHARNAARLQQVRAPGHRQRAAGQDVDDVIRIGAG